MRLGEVWAGEAGRVSRPARTVMVLRTVGDMQGFSHEAARSDLSFGKTPVGRGGQTEVRTWEQGKGLQP